jgi:multidrug efflux pump subunit AcrA (membrane-fusion protein)
MVATLDLGQAKLTKSVLVVPLGAIVSAPSGPSKVFSVFIVVRDGDKDVARQRIVTPGMTYGDMVSIAKGLSAGDRVISNGATLVNDGQVVRAIP